MKKVYTCSSAYENYEFKEARKYMADHGIELIMSTSEHPIVGKDFEALLPELDAYIVGLEKVPESVMQQGKKLKILARYGVGTDNVDFIRAKDYGMPCVSRWAGPHRGQKAFCSGLTAMPHPFTKKIDFCPLKSGVHLQWKLEVDAFFYVRPERRIAQ